MDFKNEVEKFIVYANGILNTPINTIIDKYIIDEFELPLFLNIKIEYSLLQKTHFKLNNFINQLKILILIDEENEYDNILNQLLYLKLIFDGLIKTHQDYTPIKFEKNYKRLNDSSFNMGVYIQLHEDISNKKSIFLKSLYQLLLSENRIENSPGQRKAFISLFFPAKHFEPIKWKHHIYDLKRFFDLLLKNNLIIKPKYFNKFIVNNFQILNNQKNFQNFTIKSYQTSNEKSGYQSNHNNQYSYWYSKVNDIKSKLR